MTERMPRKYRKEMFDSIEKRLNNYMVGRIEPSEIASSFNYILREEFEKERGTNGSRFSLNPEFVGEYKVDSDDPVQTRVFSHQGTEACSPIPIKNGMIGKAIREGKDLYIPDVSKAEGHIACAGVMDEIGGTEIVLLSWSEPYSSGRLKDRRVPLGALDVDLKVTDAFSEDDLKRLKRIWRTYNKRIFPGEPQFEVKAELEGLYKFLSRK
jgi:putative methionine-R-sulfoxide reductase with GAF domain